jgi:transposase-like protein
LEKVNKGDQKKVQRDLHRIQYAKSRQLAIQGFWAFCQKYREQYLGAVKSLELEIEELLSFYEVRLPAEERKGRNAEEVEKGLRKL